MKISKAFLKELKSVAESIPKMSTDSTSKTYQWVSGSKLKELGLKHKDQDDPKKRFRIESEGVRVNHYKRMVNIYENKGVEGVKNYIKEVFSISRGHESVLNGLNDRLNNLIK